jgi:putative membrane protein
MKCHVLFAASILASLGCPLLHAQASAQNQATMQASATSQPPAKMTSAADRAFVKRASAANMAEVKLGRLAISRGTNSMVKAFGQRMVHDHTAANKHLSVIAQAQSLALSSRPSPTVRKQYGKMEMLVDATFDHAYAKRALQDHRAAIRLFEREIAQGTDPAVRHYAEQTLPTLKDHLRLALKLPQG